VRSIVPARVQIAAADAYAARVPSVGGGQHWRAIVLNPFTNNGAMQIRRPVIAYNARLWSCFCQAMAVRPRNPSSPRLDCARRPFLCNARLRRRYCKAVANGDPSAQARSAALRSTAIATI